MVAVDRIIKPLNLVFEESVSTAERTAVLTAIQRVVKLGRAPEQIRIRNFGTWRQPDYLVGNVLQDFLSIDWYLARTAHESRDGQLHGGFFLKLLWNEPWQKSEPHYDVAVINQDMYDDETNFVIGLALKGFGTVISLNRLQVISEELRLECIQTAVMHEVGHVFGLVPEHRTESVEESLGKHCTNVCTMRQGLRVPHDWIRITRDRLASGQPFCPHCLHDLRSHFATPA